MNHISKKISDRFALITLLFFGFFQYSAYIRASEEAVDLLMRAFQNSGANPAKIWSGSAEFEVQIENRPSTRPNAIPDEVLKRKKEQLREIFGHNPERLAVELKKLEENSNRPIPEVHKRNLKLSILMLGNDIYFASDGQSNKRRFDLRELVQLSEPPDSNLPPSMGYVQTISISMGSPNQPTSCINVKLMPGATSVEYSNRFEDIAEFQLFGRIRELPFSGISEIFRSKLKRKDFSFPPDALSLFLNDIEKWGLTCEIIGEEIYNGTNTANVVEVHKNGVLLEKYLIDPSRGYICPYLFAIDESGTFSTEYVAEDFSILPKTDLYYPS